MPFYALLHPLLQGHYGPFNWLRLIYWSYTHFKKWTYRKIGIMRPIAVRTACIVCRSFLSWDHDDTCCNFVTGFSNPTSESYGCEDTWVPSFDMHKVNQSKLVVAPVWVKTILIKINPTHGKCMPFNCARHFFHFLQLHTNSLYKTIAWERTRASKILCAILLHCTWHSPAECKHVLNPPCITLDAGDKWIEFAEVYNRKNGLK